MPIPFLQKHKTIEEIEADNEKARAEDENAGLQLSIAEKRAAIARLKAQGMTTNDFKGNWSRIMSWLKTH